MSDPKQRAKRGSMTPKRVSPPASSPAVQAVMRGNRRRDTRPEVALRSILHRRGYRFRKDHLLRISVVPTRPDLVFRQAQLVVFVDGCFWHMCPEHGSIPSTNVDYWAPKLQGNVDRDSRNVKALEEEGWRVLRIWEHVKSLEAADLVESFLLSRIVKDSVTD